MLTNAYLSGYIHVNHLIVRRPIRRLFIFFLLLFMCAVELELYITNQRSVLFVLFILAGMFRSFFVFGFSLLSFISSISSQI